MGEGLGKQTATSEAQPKAESSGESSEPLALLAKGLARVREQHDLAAMPSEVGLAAKDLTCADSVLVAVVSADGKSYRCLAGFGLWGKSLEGGDLPLAASESGSCRMPLAANGGGQTIFAPLRHQGGPLGAIWCHKEEIAKSFSPGDCDLLEVFAEQAAYVWGSLAESQRREGLLEELAASLEEGRSALDQAHADLEKVALYDRLTGLPNRAHMQDRVRFGLALGQQDGGQSAMLVLDLDRFKQVNDTLGALAGDRILQEMGQRLRKAAPAEATVARIGGDVFGVFLPRADQAPAIEAAQAMLSSVEAPLAAWAGEFSLSASIGIAMAPLHEKSAEGLLKCAESAMLEAKQARQNIGFFQPKLQAPQALLLSKSDLQSGLAHGDFVLHFQPKINLKTRTLVSVEALARWNHPKNGLIGPGEFLPALEALGMMPKFNQWVLDSAIRQMEAWSENGLAFCVAVNVSAHSLSNPAAFDAMERAISACSVKDRLTLEITEDALLTDYGSLKNRLQTLRETGIHFSIDDFGTGHSSLSRLRQLPVTEIKIDRSFVGEMEKSSDDEVIVKSTIDLGHNLGLSVVAEGVEDQGSLRKLMDLGCDVAQGFYFGKPMSAEELERRFRAGEWGPLGEA